MSVTANVALPCLRRASKTSLSPAADLGHVNIVSGELRAQQKKLVELLEDSFDGIEINPDDGFAKKMFRFKHDAGERLQALQDLATLAQNTYNETLKFYGEDSKSISSTDEFFGVFKTFVTSYKRAKDDNQRQADQQAKAAAAAVSLTGASVCHLYMLTCNLPQARKAEAAAAAAAAAQEGDSLVEETMRKLREKSLDSPRVVRRDRRKNLAATNSPANPATTDSPGSSTVDLRASAQTLLAKLESEGVRPIPSTRRSSQRD